MRGPFQAQAREAHKPYELLTLWGKFVDLFVLMSRFFGIEFVGGSKISGSLQTGIYT